MEVGNTDGTLVGKLVGMYVGIILGIIVGIPLGFIEVGKLVGTMVDGVSVDGPYVGDTVGSHVAAFDGSFVDNRVGS